MSKACYLGTPKNVSTKTKKMYFSNNGLTVKVKKGYVSSGNKARLFWTSSMKAVGLSFVKALDNMPTVLFNVTDDVFAYQKSGDKTYTIGHINFDTGTVTDLKTNINGYPYKIGTGSVVDVQYDKNDKGHVIGCYYTLHTYNRSTDTVTDKSITETVKSIGDNYYSYTYSITDYAYFYSINGDLVIVFKEHSGNDFCYAFTIGLDENNNAVGRGKLNWNVLSPGSHVYTVNSTYGKFAAQMTECVGRSSADFSLHVFYCDVNSGISINLNSTSTSSVSNSNSMSYFPYGIGWVDETRIAVGYKKEKLYTSDDLRNYIDIINTETNEWVRNAVGVLGSADADAEDKCTHIVDCGNGNIIYVSSENKIGLCAVDDSSKVTLDSINCVDDANIANINLVNNEKVGVQINLWAHKLTDSKYVLFMNSHWTIINLKY